MFKLDHFVLNIDEAYQKDSKTIDKIVSTGFPYKPSWGKGTKGFKASNLWIGNEYFEMVNIIKPDGGGWKEDWVNLYNGGHRGLVCLMLDTDNIDKVYSFVKEKGINITTPEFLKFKWFFNLFTRTMPWKNSYLPFFEGVSLQIGFQQMKDEKSRHFMNQYMVPNSRDNNILGIKKVVIKGNFTANDMELIKRTFNEHISDNNSITIKLEKEQILIFEKNNNYHIDVFTSCHNEKFSCKNISIENITIHN